MKKVIRNIVISFVLVAMCTINIPSVLYADDTAVMAETDEKFFIFNVESQEITDYKIEGGLDVIIPDMINGKNVLGIAEGAFSDMGITSVTIPDSVKDIGTNAFMQNPSLKRIVLPKDLVKISEFAFFQCGLENVDFSKANNLTVIDNNAFARNKLTSVVFPKSLRTIGNKAFTTGSRDMPKIASVVFNEGLETIGENCFMYQGITKLILPNTVKDVKSNAFSENEIDDITFSNQLKKISANVFQGNKLEKLVIPDTVDTIDIFAFAGNQISDLTISKNVTKIWNSAFYRNKLKEVEIPASVEEIGGFAFSENELTKVIFNEGLIKIDVGAFLTNCLTNLNLPNSVQTIDSRVMDQQKATGYYKKVGDKWEFDFNNLDPKFFDSNFNPTTNIKFDGLAVNMDPVTHIIVLDTDPATKKITYDYQPYNPGNLAIKGAAGSVVLDLELFVNIYTLTFDAQGGASTSETSTILEGGKYDTLPTATREGYIFDGWYTEKNGLGDKISSNDPFTINNDQILYANWIAKDWTVNFVTNGANVEIPDQKIYTDQYAIKPDEPTKNGFNFSGWFSDRALTTPYDFSTNKITNHTSIYAGWVEIKWTVSFDTNGANEVISDQVAKTGTLINKPADPSKNGFIFSGWFSDEALTMPFNFNTDSVNANMMLYAKWVPVVGNVTPLPSTPDKPVLTDKPATPIKSATVNNTDIVNTVDETNVNLYLFTLIIAGIFIIKLAKRRNKAI